MALLSILIRGGENKHQNNHNNNDDKQTYEQLLPVCVLLILVRLNQFIFAICKFLSCAFYSLGCDIQVYALLVYQTWSFYCDVLDINDELLDEF